MNDTMMAVRANEHGELTIADVERPRPQAGQVLIKLHCAPVNPSDRMLIAGTYVQTREPPFTPGLCGVGEVIETNRCGPIGWFLNGKRVVFAPGPDLPGTWAEYAVAPASFCLPVPNGLAEKDCANLLANAMTAIALLEYAKKVGTPALVLTGAAGEVGRMINRAAGGVEIINVVRRDEQKQLLEAEGVRHVVVSNRDDFDGLLRRLVERYGARLAIDAVAGDMPARLMAAMPHGSELIIYGRLSGEDIRFDGLEYLVAKGQTLSGFNINDWVAEKSMLGVFLAARKAAAVYRMGFSCQVQHELGLPELVERFASLEDNQSEGKTLVFPGRAARP